jgi:hypothetical protein
MSKPLRLLACLALFALPAAAATPSAPAWIERSNENARLLRDIMARFTPEFAGRFGVEGLDEQVLTLPLDRTERQLEAVARAIAGLERRHFLPVFELSQTVFQGLRALLDDRVPKERHPAALVRLRKYAGLEPGTTPLAAQAEACSAPG